MKLRKIISTLLATTITMGTLVFAGTFSSSANSTILEIDFSQYKLTSEIDIAMGRDGNCLALIQNGVLKVTDRTGANKGINFYYEDLGLEEGKTYKVSIKGAILADTLAANSGMWIQLISDGNYYDDAYYGEQIVSDSDKNYDFSYTFKCDSSMFTSDLPRVRIRTNNDAGAVNFNISYVLVEEVSEAATIVETATETVAATVTTGNTDVVAASAKGSADTGVADVAVIAGIVIVAAGAVVISKKRK